MDDHIKETRTVLHYMKTHTTHTHKNKVKIKSSLMNMKTRDVVGGFRCSKYINVGLKYPETVAPSCMVLAQQQHVL